MFTATRARPSMISESPADLARLRETLQLDATTPPFARNSTVLWQLRRKEELARSAVYERRLRGHSTECGATSFSACTPANYLRRVTNVVLRRA